MVEGLRVTVVVRSELEEGAVGSCEVDDEDQDRHKLSS